jgi:hypothetical protein
MTPVGRAATESVVDGWDCPMLQVKVVFPLAPVGSVALTLTEYDPAVVALPLISPLELMESPVGRPVALYVRVMPPESVPTICRLAEVPVVIDWVPGLVTLTVLVTFQVKAAEPSKVALSVAVTSTLKGEPAAEVGVPLITPVPVLMESPVGSPVAL